jgi:uncharacterized protein YjbI with pentapeptide repeats
MDRDELLRRYAAGETRFLEVDLAGIDLRGANLSEADLREVGLQGANLENATLLDTRTGGTNFAGAFFQNITTAKRYVIEGAEYFD